MRPLLLIAALAGCAATSSREPFVLRIAMWGPLGKFDPLSSDGSLASLAHSLVFERLATVDDRGVMKPMLAASIERVAGGALRVELRHDATFSDGTPLTADDVARALEVQGARTRRDGAALIVDSADAGLPAEVALERAAVFRQEGGRFLGTGAFTIASQSETELRFVRRERRPGHVDEVWLIAYSTPRDAFAHTLKGDANAIVDLEPRWLEFFRDVPRLRIVRGGGHGVEAIVFNGRFPRDERLRLARALASPRVRDLAYGKGECAEQGPEAVDEELPPGAPLRVLSWGPMERLGLAARRALGRRGGEALHLGAADVLSRLHAKDFDLVTIRPIAWPASAIGIVWRTGSPDNFSGYSNPSFDRAIEAGNWTAAEAALRADPPAAFVCTRAQLAVVDARIRNAKLGPLEVVETLPDWEVAQ